MSRAEWDKVRGEKEEWLGPRAAYLKEVDDFGIDTAGKMRTILDAMDWQQLLLFKYGDSDRVVAPFVVGVSSEGNPLLRGFQLEGVSRSGKGPGWRVFQIKKMEKVANFWEYFEPDDFDFDEFYPWTYKVFKML
jgi:hypothetical protein